MTAKIYDRTIIENIKKWLERPEIIVITGSRQTGKTFLARRILPQVTGKSLRYFNFEDFELRELFRRNPKEFVSSISDKGSIYVFDEFQKAPELAGSLKVLYDSSKEDLPKILLTGSSWPEIQRKVSQSLVGQCVVFQLFSLSFLEKYSFKERDFLRDLVEAGDSYLEALKNDLFFEQNEIKRKFNEYLLEGGYPELGELGKERKWEKLKSIIQAVLEKDLQSLVKSEHLFSSKKLLEILAFRIGNLISFENLASEMQLNIKTVRNLIAILAGLFFVELIYPAASFANEYKKAPKVYFHDLGMRSELTKTRMLPLDHAQMGGLVENFVFSQLRRYAAYRRELKINFWQNYNRNEVDFVLGRGNELFSIEVKYRKTDDKISAGVRNFVERYRPLFHITVTQDYFGSKEMGQCKIYFIPAYAFGMLV
ncbi:MAG: ATP-binding protein [Armatimonadetes bacterium]|nr:ATP-binding protein [Armatimonadota bacterium]